MNFIFGYAYSQTIILLSSENLPTWGKMVGVQVCLMVFTSSPYYCELNLESCWLRENIWDPLLNQCPLLKHIKNLCAWIVFSWIDCFDASFPSISTSKRAAFKTFISNFEHAMHFNLAATVYWMRCESKRTSTNSHISNGKIGELAVCVWPASFNSYCENHVMIISVAIFGERSASVPGSPKAPLQLLVLSHLTLLQTEAVPSQQLDEMLTYHHMWSDRLMRLIFFWPWILMSKLLYAWGAAGWSEFCVKRKIGHFQRNIR